MSPFKDFLLIFQRRSLLIFFVMTRDGAVSNYRLLIALECVMSCLVHFIVFWSTFNAVVSMSINT